ncbi:molybdopterin-guanine dinucleotide biosynthesis protein B [Bacillus sp. FJAT-49736]|uniref:molybdopterin-guanine dinucleotide biosynthesis protein B n=1 Tax=Bacillus sp. FJAT-49736 TaxID=2833582 RepID=UPI001BC977AE|nr:molybdopterin-guanine dinucleotide biosynthesis protein B [Bacillus sp. FJAT-49736]MBS4173114.1 molybdopterin-guanine dinucleotide biosynthesis protein B [Bacillus sp. FJAT-49736]
MERGTQIFQIVGFKNSGKTTLIERIIQYGNSYGMQSGTIKHHGHGGGPNVPISDKDTDKHLKSGALYTAVEGDGSLLIQNHSKDWSLNEIIEMYNHLSLDLILIEGYKHGSFPKAVLIRKKEDLGILEELSNIQAVLTWFPLNEDIKFPVFSVNEPALFIDWLFQFLFGHEHHL